MISPGRLAHITSAARALYVPSPVARVAPWRKLHIGEETRGRPGLSRRAVPVTWNYEPCRICYPRDPAITLPFEDYRCGSKAEDTQHRSWIVAHGGVCCGHEHRTLVLCFDGTGEQFDESSSNVVRFCSMLKNDDYGRQLVYYQSGVGTFLDPLGFHLPSSPRLSLILDQMFAWNLENHIKDAYTFLMQNYTDGDRICLLGYSRGAYTARALAAMLHKVGLLPIDNHRQLQPAFDLYRREDEHGPLLAHRFKSLYARSVQIEFLGLWDTVASVGLPSRHLPMFESEGVRYVRHAVALDERRIKFRPHFCYDPAVEREPDKRSHLALQPEDIEQSERSGSAATNTQEVWFAGVHSDIGGGAFDDNELPTPRLSRIPLRWMIRQCFETSTGIVFDACMLREAGLSVSRTTNIDEHSQGVGAASPTYALEPTYDWSPGPLQEREAAPKRLAPSTSTKFRTIASRLLFGWADNARTPDEDMWNYTPQEWERLNDSRDASQDIHCPLKTNPFWWLLELMPLSIETTMAEKLKTGDSYALVRNRGRGRRMFHHTMPGPWKIHRTVKIRLESRPEYIPQARPELTATGHSVRQKIPANRLAHLDWNQNDPSAWNWVP